MVEEQGIEEVLFALLEQAMSEEFQEFEWWSGATGSYFSADPSRVERASQYRRFATAAAIDGREG